MIQKRIFTPILACGSLNFFGLSLVFIQPSLRQPIKLGKIYIIIKFNYVYLIRKFNYVDSIRFQLKLIWNPNPLLTSKNGRLISLYFYLEFSSEIAICKIPLHQQIKKKKRLTKFFNRYNILECPRKWSFLVLQLCLVLRGLHMFDHFNDMLKTGSKVNLRR